MKTSVTQKRRKSAGNQNKGSIWSSELELALFALVHVVIFIVLFHTLYKTPYTGTGIFFDYGSKVLKGLLPYRDFSLEYPPFSLLFFILPRLVASTYKVYAIVFQYEVLIFDLVGLFLMYKIARRLGKAPWKLLTIYTISTLAIGPIIAQQYDIFPAIMTLLALYYFWLGKHKTSWALLALGTMTKLYPAVIAPIFLVYYIRNRQYKHIRSGIITFASICLAVLLPFLVINLGSIGNLINYQAGRGIQMESTYGAFLLAADKLGLTSVNLVFNFGSWNLSSPLANSLDKLSTYLLALFLLIAYWFIYRQMKPGKSQFTRIGAYSLLVISITLIASKVLSPQYLIWLIPLIPLLFSRWRYTMLAVFIVIGALTYYIFPVNYLALMDFNTGVIAVLVLRDTLLILLAVLSGISLRRMKASD